MSRLHGGRTRSAYKPAARSRATKLSWSKKHRGRSVQNWRPPGEKQQSFELLASLPFGMIGFLQRPEEVAQTHISRDYDVVESEHHFLPALLAEANCRG